MYNNIYLLRDTVSKTVKFCFSSVNDGSAVRYVCDLVGKDPHFKDYELWRYDSAYDVETMESKSIDRAVIALPSPENAPTMPLSNAGVTPLVTK